MAGELRGIRSEMAQQRQDAQRQADALGDNLGALTDTVDRLAKAIEADREDRAKRWPR